MVATKLESLQNLLPKIAQNAMCHVREFLGTTWGGENMKKQMGWVALMVGAALIVPEFLFLSTANAAIEDASGITDVVQNYGSGDAQVLINGDAAKELYKHLLVDDGGYDVKMGKNIMCRKRMPLEDNTDGDFECSLKISPQGEVRKLGMTNVSEDQTN